MRKLNSDEMAKIVENSRMVSNIIAKASLPSVFKQFNEFKKVNAGMAERRG